MLALQDVDHIVRFNAFGLARRANMDEAEVLEALKVLASPDTRRLEPQPYEGRRIEQVPEGWLILNGEVYKAMMSVELKRARNRRSQAAWRERQKAKQNGGPLPGETRYVKTLVERGQEAADAEM